MNFFKNNFSFFLVALFAMTILVSCQQESTEDQSEISFENLLRDAEVGTYTESEINDILNNVNTSKTRKAKYPNGNDANSFHRLADVFVDILPIEEPDGIIDTRWTWCFNDGIGCSDQVNFLKAYFISYNITHLWIEECDNNRSGSCK